MKGARRSLNELLGWTDEKSPFRSTTVVNTEKALATRLEDLDVGQIRLLVGQGFGLEHVLPLALEILEDNPFIEATFYRGDLLEVCLKVDQEFWATHEDLWVSLNDILHDLDRMTDQIKPARSTFMQYVGAS